MTELRSRDTIRDLNWNWNNQDAEAKNYGDIKNKQKKIESGKRRYILFYGTGIGICV